MRTMPRPSIPALAVGISAADFAAVKAAFEKNCGCMGINGADVGGLHDEVSSSCHAGASPAGGSGGSNSTAIAVGVTVGVIAVLLLGFCYCYCKKRKASEMDPKFANGSHSSAGTDVSGVS